ncbi:MAG TPA: hypothetical protein VKG85_02525 [Actinomycetes bacterium]|nr:hypothetical protein [Actinomycetes bacterium]
MNTTDLDEVARYAATVRAELDDLPTEERDELLEDLEDHLREVAADADGPLAYRIGPPGRYAEELRASAGLVGSGDRPRRDRLRWNWRALRGHPATRATLEFFVQLRPVWWLARAYVVVQFLSWMIYAKTNALIPILFGSQLVGLAVLVPAGVISVQLGRRAAATGRTDARYLVANTLLVLLTGSFAVQLAELDDDPGYPPLGPSDYVNDGLWNGGGLVTNIIPVDSKGRLLTDVYLYDQDGQPLVQSVWDGVHHWRYYCRPGEKRVGTRENVYPHDLAKDVGTWLPYELPPNLALKGERPAPQTHSCEPLRSPPWER